MKMHNFRKRTIHSIAFSLSPYNNSSHETFSVRFLCIHLSVIQPQSGKLLTDYINAKSGSKTATTDKKANEKKTAHKIINEQRT